MKITDRFRNSWNAFLNRDPTINNRLYDNGSYYSTGSYYRPDRQRMSRGKDRSIVTSVLNRMALDVASIKINHCRLDEDDRFKEVMTSSLNDCFTLETNTDQTFRAFMQDAVMSMFDEGHVVLVPVDTSIDPNNNNSYDILSMRTGKVVEWFPKHVKVNVYNERTGRREDILIAKSAVSIIENPFYAVMNEPNSTLQRLLRKLILLDSIDEQSSSGKLDLIIQLPYIVKSEARKQQANERRQEIERQLTGSKYGIAYTDGTEKITQLNRPVENNLMKQIEYLTNLLFSQLNITQSVLDGTADEKTMLNYNNRTVEPIVAAFVDEMKRKFLTKTARTQKQTIMYFNDTFKLVPANDLAEIADKFTRNEILTKNEFRQIIGMKPSNDPKADMLLNSNISQPNSKQVMNPVSDKITENSEKDAKEINRKEEIQNGL